MLIISIYNLPFLLWFFPSITHWLTEPSLSPSHRLSVCLFVCIHTFISQIWLAESLLLLKEYYFSQSKFLPFEKIIFHFIEDTHVDKETIYRNRNCPKWGLSQLFMTHFFLALQTILYCEKNTIYTINT